MSPVEKETAENFYGTGERDHKLMLQYDGVRGCDSERDAGWPERRTVPGGQKISLAGALCGYVCDRFEFTHDGAEISAYLAAARAHSGIFPFLWCVPDGQASMYIGKGLEGRAGE